ncbi:MAG TPA: HNH endonuclease [Candidatus Hydrogenedentes bacterium]|nr:HNH endonuclease [Candidatus Hydrogenedentota bacterium]
MPSKSRPWERAELLAVFRLYCATPFGKLDQRNPEIIALASRLGRTAGAVAMKANNFSSIDPKLKQRNIKGLHNASSADRELWNRFLSDPEAVALEAEAAYENIMGTRNDPMIETEGELPPGPTEKVLPAKARLLQSFFRSVVLGAYENRCALTGIGIPGLLNASHIIPWHVDEKRRADPTNGICLNALHDRAFDRGLITFDQDYRVVVSSQLLRQKRDSALHEILFVEIMGRPLTLPKRFLPDPAALEYHRTRVFRP